MSIELMNEGLINFSGGGTYSFTADGIYMNGTKYLKSSNYIRIHPEYCSFKYDFTVSVSAGNLFYIGWERYDIDKTARSNDACVYKCSIKPTTDLIRARYRGTIDLSTDGVNPAAYVKLRILNKWSGSETETTGIGILHSISLLAIPTLENISTQMLQNGLIQTDHFRELENISIARNGYFDSSILYEY